MKLKRLGLVGMGGMMNGHVSGHMQNEDCTITAICDIKEERLKIMGDKLGIPEELRFTDYRDLLKCGVIDVVDIATTNDVHVKIALDALDAGFPVSVEKPIGMNFSESAALYRKAREKNLPVFVCFSWRYMDKPRYMRHLIEEGKLGRLYQINVKSIKDSALWEGRKLEWRFIKERASSGVLCDLGSHMFDMVRFFGEEFESVFCSSGTIVKRRELEDGSGWGDVTTDDWSNAVCRLKSGIDATVQVSRIHTNVESYVEFELIGEDGTLRFEAPNWKDTKLLACLGEDTKTNTFRELEVPQEFVSSGQSRAFLDMVDGKIDSYTAEIGDGMRSQAAVDAALISSELGRSVSIKELYEKEGLECPEYTKVLKEFRYNIKNKMLEEAAK